MERQQVLVHKMTLTCSHSSFGESPMPLYLWSFETHNRDFEVKLASIQQYKKWASACGGGALIVAVNMLFWQRGEGPFSPPCDADSFVMTMGLYHIQTKKTITQQWPSRVISPTAKAINLRMNPSRIHEEFATKIQD